MIKYVFFFIYPMFIFLISDDMTKTKKILSLYVILTTTADL